MHKASGMCPECGGACKMATENRKLPKPNLEGLYKGGNVKGVHESSMEIDRPKDKREKKFAGSSYAGDAATEINDPDAKYSLHKRDMKDTALDEHHRVIGEMKAMPNPKLKGLAKGGVAGEDGEPMEDMDASMDHELMDACCGELLNAIESKNKKEILESLKAIILSMGK
jgi:hypothetical protein